MTAVEIRAAVDAGSKVFWSGMSYQVTKDNRGEYFITAPNGHKIGLTWSDNTTLNGNPKDFFVVTDPQEKAIAEKFSEKLRLWLTEEELSEVIRLNKTEEYSNCCASHNFCDPNQAMWEAFTEVVGSDADTSMQSDLDTMNSAWNHAKQHQFFIY